MISSSLLLAFLQLCLASPVEFRSQQQIPLQPNNIRNLHGRFLHITDIHPDPYYRPDTSVSTSCHRKKPKSETPRAGVYGTPGFECDSPTTLIDLTFEWIEKEWADQIDFVIWTGDSARHDNDRFLPRTPSEIFKLNREMVKRMQNIFRKRGIPVVPTIGNNDIWPHNIMPAGPNSITSAFSDIWSEYIPFPSYQIFRRGAYFTSDIIANKLAVISLNTLYFFDSNKAVGGCEWVNRAEVGGENADPGNLELDWFEVQLELLRSRGMKVWIIGHVPPSEINYYPECYWRYAEIVLRFQDTIVGQIFGHMNVDHFAYLGVKDLRDPPEERSFKAKKKNLFRILMRSFSRVKEASRTDLDTYSIIHTSPSVVPNPYLPTMRIWGYNVSDLNLGVIETNDNNDNNGEQPELRNEGKIKDARPKRKRCKHREDKYKWWCKLPQRPWFSDENSPSRKNGPLTPLGYTQWWIPNVTVLDPDPQPGNGTEPPTWEIEYATYQADVLYPASNSTSSWLPIPAHLVPNATSLKNLLPYRMPDGTIGSWVDLARRIGDDEDGLRDVFYKFFYLGSGPK